LGALGKDKFARARHMIMCGWFAFLLFAMPRATNARGWERFEITARGGQTRGGTWGWALRFRGRARASQMHACENDHVVDKIAPPPASNLSMHQSAWFWQVLPSRAPA